jgi:hypothetical protein
MCTFKSSTEVMVCDVSRNRVRDVLERRFGAAFGFETVHGEGTRVTCAHPDRAGEFEATIRRALVEPEVGSGLDEARATAS